MGDFSGSAFNDREFCDEGFSFASFNPGLNGDFGHSFFSAFFGISITGFIRCVIVPIITFIFGGLLTGSIGICRAWFPRPRDALGDFVRRVVSFRQTYIRTGSVLLLSPELPVLHFLLSFHKALPGDIADDSLSGAC
jgi:membrane-bound metal-dependent hydrolase YbcI (DUF457 family)